MHRPPPESDPQIVARAEVLLKEQIRAVHTSTSHVFVLLLGLQWFAGIIIAVLVSPRTWSGEVSSLHLHVQAALVLGFLLSSFPMYLARTAPASPLTRHVIAASQLLWSGLLVHLSGGRIETHFHVFGSLAFLAFYRDWRIFITATLVVATDHLFRGMLLPQSIYGVLSASPWRTAEHTGWVLFESAFLTYSCCKSAVEMRTNCLRQAASEHASRELEKKIREEEVLRSDLHAALKKSEAASAAKGAFVAHMSHEIRTPLNGIQGSIKLIGKTELLPAQRGLAELALRSCEALSAIINDVLDLSKIEAGKMDFDEDFFDIRQLVEHAIDMQQPRAIEKSLLLTSFVAPDVPRRISADADRLRQVLLNLISNAVKFTNEGHVVVEVHCDEVVDNHCSLFFTVQDSGIGIAKSKQGSLFEAFTQADVSTTKRYGGTGLGLTICRDIVQAMHGTIGLESRPGEGSTFWFGITFECEASKQEPPHRLAQVGALSRILLVGRNERFQRILSSQLECVGFTTERVSKMQEIPDALREAIDEELPFTVALITDSDVDAIERDGIAIAEELTTLNPPTPLAVLLGARFQPDHAKTIGAFAQPLDPSKPVDAILAFTTAPKSGSQRVVVKPRARPEQLVLYPQARVLLGEDNEINQLIASEFLREHQIEPTVVENGELVVKLLSEGEFDLVLLDCHMPDMDGFEAARRVREREKQLGKKRVPIVALTADVTIETREHCKAMGMDSYLSKPLNPDLLSNVLKRFLPIPTESPLQTPINLAALEAKFNRSEQLVSLVLQQFEMQLRNDLEAIAAHLTAGDAEKLFMTAHGLKGAAAAAGALGVREVARELEQCGKLGRIADTPPLFTRLKAEADSCLNFLQESSIGITRQ